MIAAIGFNVNENCIAKIYLVGTYNDIDWNCGQECVLGEEYTTFDFKDIHVAKNAISIETGLDDEYILRLTETKRYMLKLEGTTADIIGVTRFQNEANKFLKLDKDENSISFQFINYLGRSKIVFGENEEVKCLQFEVIPDKMSYEDDYIGLTEALARVCAELLLEHSGSTSNVYSQMENSQGTLLEQFIFLRQFCYSQNLMGLFESIKRNPDQLLVHEEELKPLGYGMPSKKFYSNPFAYSRGWRKNENGGLCSSGYLPQEVAVTKKYDSSDTPANRFIKYALAKFNSVCEELIQILILDEESKQAECVKEAKAIHCMLEDIFNDSFFDDIGTFDIMPQNNQVLQKREGYAQIFSAYSMMDLALQLDWKGKNDIYEGESKNVALLYEYWLFFELYKIIKSIDECELAEVKEQPFLIFNDGRITVSLEQGKKSCQSFEISRLKTKINLYYNRTFSKTEFRTTKYEGSYSRPFRPDYTIAVFPNSFCKGRYNGEEEAIRDGAVSYIHFDAKYRISDLTALIGKNTEKIEDGEFLEDKMGAVINTYKRGDLLKMHTYNDAIRRTIGSYVLYPGSNDFSQEGSTSFSLYDEILPGVGAFAIKPSIDSQGENELKNFITTLLESKEKYNSRLNRMKYYTEMVLREPVVAALDVRGNMETQGDNQDGRRINVSGEEMYVIGYIRSDSNADYYFSLKDNNLLKKGAEFLFYFYAITGKDVYSHHKDIFKATKFRFYTNSINETGTYRLEPVLCKIVSNELLSREELVGKLKKQGYNTDEKNHHADFYYALSVQVIKDDLAIEDIEISEINAKNGNDTFSPHSPKVIYS